MLLLVAIAVPVATLFLTCRISARAEKPAPRRAHARSRPFVEGRWEALSAEVARLERGRVSPDSDAAMHRRHLAAVLPADARR